MVSTLIGWTGTPTISRNNYVDGDLHSAHFHSILEGSWHLAEVMTVFLLSHSDLEWDQWSATTLKCNYSTTVVPHWNACMLETQWMNSRANEWMQRRWQNELDFFCAQKLMHELLYRRFDDNLLDWVTKNIFLVNNRKWMFPKNRWLCKSYLRPHLKGYRPAVYSAQKLSPKKRPHDFVLS